MIPINNKTGYLEIYIGSMYAGKTSRLLNIYRQLSLCNIKVLVINHTLDNRYTTKSFMISHDNISSNCILINNLYDNIPLDSDILKNHDAFIINEAQFYSDIYDWVKTVIDVPYNKHVYLCGLDSDYKKKSFGNWLNLIPHCDKVEKLTSICSNCKRNVGIFTHRLNECDDQIHIGTKQYIPVCRSCYSILNT